MKRDDHKLLTDPTVEFIKPYTFTSRGIEHDRRDISASYWRKLCATMGGFNPVTRELTPMQYVTANMSVHEALDHITAAAEAGVIDKNAWASQLFAGEHELEGFLDDLEGYDECYRITDRWWTALYELTGTIDEEGFVRSDEIAETLRESIEAGAKRRELLRLQAEYLAQHPLKKINLTREQEEALNRHNRILRMRAMRDGIEDDASTSFPLSPVFYYMKGDVLAARQVTGEDLKTLMRKTTVKSRSSSDKASRPAKG